MKDEAEKTWSYLRLLADHHLGLAERNRVGPRFGPLTPTLSPKGARVTAVTGSGQSPL